MLSTSRGSQSLPLRAFFFEGKWYIKNKNQLNKYLKCKFPLPVPGLIVIFNDNFDQFLIYVPNLFEKLKNDKKFYTANFNRCSVKNILLDLPNVKRRNIRCYEGWGLTQN